MPVESLLVLCIARTAEEEVVEVEEAPADVADDPALTAARAPELLRDDLLRTGREAGAAFALEHRTGQAKRVAAERRAGGGGRQAGGAHLDVI